MIGQSDILFWFCFYDTHLKTVREHNVATSLDGEKKRWCTLEEKNWKRKRGVEEN